MLRSERCFRKQGMEVIPAPCHFDGPPQNLDDFVPDGAAILTNEKTIHEVIGVGWYLVKGRI
jgi:hypothetical protein